eukprot:CAMPEP_0177632896 /NCGR_PEP_ID=MMETSP0447-20121125/2547_1 /TAXON_ID=0 /ORGANISM="Stygamoeba regulata, Strain BSH-02190019" /LENGTH=179 /DNA_ID=CAMNT_0019134517 /DNA_START=451 /DNA_END=988 /DNA_ORIENTATION=-
MDNFDSTKASTERTSPSKSSPPYSRPLCLPFRRTTPPTSCTTTQCTSPHTTHVSKAVKLCGKAANIPNVKADLPTYHYNALPPAGKRLDAFAKKVLTASHNAMQAPPPRSSTSPPASQTTDLMQLDISAPWTMWEDTMRAQLFMLQTLALEANYVGADVLQGRDLKPEVRTPAAATIAP